MTIGMKEETGAADEMTSMVLGLHATALAVACEARTLSFVSTVTLLEARERDENRHEGVELYC